MARNDGIDRTSVRNLAVSDKAVGNTQQHNEREKDSYRNPDIIPQRTAWNIHFKKPTASYTDLFSQLETAGTISTRGLKPDATHYCELVFDVNSAYFDNHGGYEFAKQFYEWPAPLPHRRPLCLKGSEVPRFPHRPRSGPVLAIHVHTW